MIIKITSNEKEIVVFGRHNLMNNKKKEYCECNPQQINNDKLMKNSFPYLNTIETKRHGNDKEQTIAYITTNGYVGFSNSPKYVQVEGVYLHIMVRNTFIGSVNKYKNKNKVKDLYKMNMAL